MEVLNRPEPGIEVKPYIDPDRPEGMEARKRIARLFSAALLILGRSVAKQVARRFRELGKADDPTVEDLMRMLSIEFDDDLEDDLVDELGRIYSSSGQAALSQVGVATADQLTNRVNEGAIAWAERHVGDLIGLNPDTESWVSMATRNMIRGTIVDAMRDNLS